ncbi:50S ribosomal protein L6 [[Limnothrix rosea] IAM M-220]|uniref:50S ribosomal protein L6 n=1 Tax=[Limnothrix rosea] IAM M-220 TaxID=454133 RepID=UPI0009697F44|nr:50S ribosomal protein L6 [[Limnothrix rosea] IAM M-220]OKH17196.1 50S ribosomal protein L6 [[Limnothrix rosea] IAM M-220]
MSRIGKKPVPIPDKVTVSVDGLTISVKGPKGTLERTLPEKVKVVKEDNSILISPVDSSRPARERHGLCRTLVANMVEGVSNGYSKNLEIIGVGYRAQVKGNTLTLNVGYSKPVEMVMPEGITVAMGEKNTQVIISGIDKEVVGNTAAKVRAVRPPEPYKGKGIRYQGEHVRRKAGKAGK